MTDINEETPTIDLNDLQVSETSNEKKVKPSPTEIKAEKLLDEVKEERRQTEMMIEEAVFTEHFDQKKRGLLLLLTRYRNSRRFADYLTEEMKFDLSHENLSSKSVRELETMLEDVRYCVANKNNMNLVASSATKIIGVLEPLVSKVYKVDGLSRALESNPVFMDTLEEFALSKDFLTNASPSTRMMLEVVKTAYIVHESHIYFERLSKENPEKFKKLGEQLKNQNIKKDDSTENDEETTKERPVSPSFEKKIQHLL